MATSSAHDSKASGSPPRTPRAHRGRPQTGPRGRGGFGPAPAGRLGGACAAIVATLISYHTGWGRFRIASMLDPSRTVAELRELQELTGDSNGAQRVAWTDTWEKARDWLRAKA